MRRAFFVAVEGIDGSGKTTLTAALAAELRRQGLLVSEYREPSPGPVGRLFRRMSATGEWSAMTMALLSSADRHAQQQHLAAALQHSQVLVADRYYLSGLAYHAADGVDPAFYQLLNQSVAKPDAYLYLGISPVLAARRIHGGPDDYWERREFATGLPGAYEAGLALVTAGVEDARVVRIDAAQPAAAVLDAALAAVHSLREPLEGTG
jgi:dTMP kinase